MSDMPRPRIILADDHAVLREGLAALIGSEFDVVGAVGDGRALLVEAERLSPDAIILDVGMPLLNGMEAGWQLRNVAPKTKLIFLSQHASKEYIQAAFRLGASAYVLKSAAAAELGTALSEAFAGRRYLCAELRERYGDPEPELDGKATGIFESTLTPRQREVLQLIAEGKSAKEIAFVLGISVKTVEFHKAAIMDELGIRTTAELTRYALEHRILPS
jgi:DNA-binding NarL/FixJ family response regulator